MDLPYQKRRASARNGCRSKYSSSPDPGAYALEGERKQVTVLFADLKDSTRLIEGLDMEQLATSGTILLPAATLRPVEGLVQVQPLGALPVKGLTEPVEAYERGLHARIVAALEALTGDGLSEEVERLATMPSAARYGIRPWRTAGRRGPGRGRARHTARR
jgi:hypothetical protein